MKTNSLVLSLAVLSTLAGIARAQSTYLSGTNGNPMNAVVEHNDGNINSNENLYIVVQNLSVIGSIVTALLNFTPIAAQLISLDSSRYYGIGLQANRTYFRSGSGFSWFLRGEHTSTTTILAAVVID